jgi:hypothetical protein
MGNLNTELLDRRRDNDACTRFVDVEAALRMWRRTLIAEMANADFAPDSEKTETLLDLLHGEMEECGTLMNAVNAAAERIRERRQAWSR